MGTLVNGLWGSLEGLPQTTVTRGIYLGEDDGFNESPHIKSCELILEDSQKIYWDLNHAECTGVANRAIEITILRGALGISYIDSIRFF